MRRDTQGVDTEGGEGRYDMRKQPGLCHICTMRKRYIGKSDFTYCPTCENEDGTPKTPSNATVPQAWSPEDRERIMRIVAEARAFLTTFYTSWQDDELSISPALELLVKAVDAWHYDPFGPEDQIPVRPRRQMTDAEIDQEMAEQAIREHQELKAE